MSDAPARPNGGRTVTRGDRLAWYWNRLRSMSPAEISHRFQEQGRRLVSRARVPDFERELGPAVAELPVLPGLADGIGRVAAEGDVVDTWTDLERRVRENRFQFLGLAWPEGSGPPDWHLDPVSGRHWPNDVYCFDIPYRHTDRFGDVKAAWELGRLQYLQPLAALATIAEDRALADLVIGHVESWIDANPPFKGVNWASGIECALRVVSLLVVVSLIDGRAMNPLTRRRITTCLASHGYWIQRFPSRFSSANNHLIAEGAALFLLGALAPKWPRTARWAKAGRDILEREVRLQFHADGVGAEQSPAYASFSLEWLLLAGVVGARLGQPFSDGFWQRLATAGEYLRAITDAGGNQPRIGDDDDSRVLASGFGPEPYGCSVLANLAHATGRPDLAPPVRRPHLRDALFGATDPGAPGAGAPDGLKTFRHGGYSVAREWLKQREILTVFDHGPLGYLSIAAHGHADALSLWLHVDGRPVLIDAGTFCYHGDGAWRDYFRGSAAHNTLLLEGDDQSVIAGPFNWGEKAETRLIESDAGEHWAVEAEHDGYRSFYQYRHRRRLERIGPGELMITDRLLGDGGVRRVEVGFLFAPGLTVGATSRGWDVRAGDRVILEMRHEGNLKGWVESGRTAPKSGWVSPSFGVRLATQRLVFAGKMWNEAPARFHITVAG